MVGEAEVVAEPDDGGRGVAHAATQAGRIIAAFLGRLRVVI